MQESSRNAASADDLWPQEPPAPRKKRRALLWFAIIGGVCLAGVAALVAFGVLFVVSTKPSPLQPDDLDAMLTAADLLEAMESDFVVDESLELSGRERYLDGSVEVNYECDLDEPPLYVLTSISLENSVSDARLVFKSVAFGAGLGVSLVDDADVALEDLPEALSWGDESKVQLMTANGDPIGNLVVARKGAFVFMTTFSGVYFDDIEMLEELLEPKLEAMTTLKK